MKYLVLLMLNSEIVLAAGSGHGSPMDLLPSAVNVLILASLIIFGLRGKLSAFFTAKSTSITEMLESASAKAKEAEMMMEMNKKKMDGAAAEIAQKKSDATETIASFEKEYKAEVELRVSKMKEDAGQKIEAEKIEMLSELNATLLDEVIAKAKSQIKSDSKLSDNAAKNLIQGLQ